MSDLKTQEENEDGALFPPYSIGIVAIVCAAVLIIMAALGPLGTGDIHYRTSQSGLWQLEGQDLTDMVLMVPLLLIGGALSLMRRDGAKYFLVLTPISLMYTGLSVGIGQEWGGQISAGNVESYFWIFLTLVIGGLFLLIGTLSMFTQRDAPKFNRKGLRTFAVLLGLALALFAFMWLGQIMQVVGSGDLADGSYTAAPVSFWVIRYLDLGISVPVGFMALFLLMTRPKRAYSLVLLFFGFFITTGTAVNMMALMMALNSDAGVSMLGPMIAIFPILGALGFLGLYYLIRDKVREGRENGVSVSPID